MSERITDKAQMYRHLAAGDFGNTIRQFFDVAAWEDAPDARRYDSWGVRSLSVGGPCRLFCPREEVAETARSFACPVNISMMIDIACNVTLWADIWDSPTGLIVYGIEYPPKGESWRKLMPTHGRHWHGVAARLMLRKHLNPNSYDDAEAVFERWPGHILEVSACEQCIGVVPGRNGVVWELRAY